MGAISSVAIPFIHRINYPQGGTHLLPLLELSLPGIDLNDPSKTFNTLQFYAKIFVCVPLVEAFGITDKYQFQKEDPLLNEINNQCRDATFLFEDWLIGFIKRVFILFDNLPQLENSSKHTNIETGIVQMLLFVCEIVFIQLSPDLVKIAIEKVT